MIPENVHIAEIVVVFDLLPRDERFFRKDPEGKCSSINNNPSNIIWLVKPKKNEVCPWALLTLDGELFSPVKKRAVLHANSVANNT